MPSLVPLELGEPIAVLTVAEKPPALACNASLRTLWLPASARYRSPPIAFTLVRLRKRAAAPSPSTKPPRKGTPATVNTVGAPPSALTTLRMVWLPLSLTYAVPLRSAMPRGP